MVKIKGARSDWKRKRKKEGEVGKKKEVKGRER